MIKNKAPSLLEYKPVKDRDYQITNNYKLLLLL